MTQWYLPLVGRQQCYLSNYDMGRSDNFTAQNVYSDYQVEQLFT